MKRTFTTSLLGIALALGVGGSLALAPHASDARTVASFHPATSSLTFNITTRTQFALHAVGRHSAALTVHATRQFARSSGHPVRGTIHTGAVSGHGYAGAFRGTRHYLGMTRAGMTGHACPNMRTATRTSGK